MMIWRQGILGSRCICFASSASLDGFVRSLARIYQDLGKHEKRNGEMVICTAARVRYRKSRMPQKSEWIARVSPFA